MEFKRELWIRIGIVLLGILVISVGIYNFILDLSPVIDSVKLGDLQNINYSFSQSYLAFVFMAIGFIVYYIGRHWTYSLKNITNTLVMLAVFCVTVGIILYGINIKTSSVVDSIQPSIDYMIASSIDEVIANQIEIKDGESLSIILADNIQSEKIYSKNITNLQAEKITKELGLTSLNSEQQIVLGKIIVSTVYEEMLKNGPEFSNVPIPLSVVKSQIENSGVDLSLIRLFDISVFESLFTINEQAYLNILIADNIQKKNIVIGNLNSNDVNLIWKNLGISPNISQESQIELTNIILSVMKSEMQKSKIENVEIPLASLKDQIPQDYKKLFNYDLLNSNLTIKQNELTRVRSDCQINKLDVKEVCDIIEMTSYDNFMSNINNLTNGANLDLPINVSSVLENVNTIDNVEKTINKKTDSYLMWFFIGGILYLISILTYFGHFKLFKRELIPLHIPYYISKVNLFNVISTFVLLGIFIYLFNSGMALEFISNIVPQTSGIDIIDLVSHLPIYIILLDLLDFVLILTGWFLVVSLVIYLGFFIWLKIEVEKYEKSTSAPKFED